jgi:hypothetical protein
MESSTVFSSIPDAATTLHLPRHPVVAAYEATVVWEAYANGDYQCSTIQKHVVVQAQPLAGQGHEISFRTQPPVLTKPQDLQPLEQIAVRLAALYERVVVQAAPTGAFVALLNHKELQQTWAGFEQELRDSTTDDDQVTKTLLAFVRGQLQTPEQFLQSLQHDYLYQALLPTIYQQGGASAAPLVKKRVFSNFFDKTPLVFSEEITVQPAEQPEQLMLAIRGTIDKQSTPMPAVAALISKALQLAPAPSGAPALPAVLPEPHFGYEATYVLDQPTGLPGSVELTVYARAGELFNKQYSLTIARS